MRRTQVDIAQDLCGNLTSKSDGTETTTYTWSEDGRLIQVTLPGDVTVSYTCDSVGRMLTRTHSTDGTSKFVWNGWDCIREIAATHALPVVRPLRHALLQSRSH